MPSRLATASISPPGSGRTLRRHGKTAVLALPAYTKAVEDFEEQDLDEHLEKGGKLS
jgi:hypothetical protein